MILSEAFQHRPECPARALLGALVLALGMTACGGKPEAKHPEGGSEAGEGAASSASSKPTGQSGATQAAAAARPKMNAAAAEAYGAGLAAFQRGDLEGARAQFEKAIAADPKAFEAHYSLGVVRERLGSPSGAMSSYRSALDVMPDYEAAIAAYAQLLLLSDRASEAESFLNGLRTKLPESAAVLASLAEVKSVQGNSAEAQELAQLALKKDPDYRPAMVVLARDHYRARRLDLALYTLTAVLDGYGTENPARDKNNGEARLLRALIYKEQGKRRPAIDELKKTLELRPDLVEARLNLAAFMLEAGNAAEAAPILEQALSYANSNVLVHLNLGDAYRLLGRPDESIKQLDWVSKADPSLAQTHYNLALVYMFSPQIPGVTPKQAIDKAIGELETYKKMQPHTRPGAGDDVDELLSRARNKKAILEATEAEAAPASATPAAPAPTSGGAAQ
jgi:tetratricopeptide (TPR) repeat protein